MTKVTQTLPLVRLERTRCDGCACWMYEFATPRAVFYIRDGGEGNLAALSSAHCPEISSLARSIVSHFLCSAGYHDYYY